MNNFCGKRFLSALMGALSVLGSSVASAVGGKLGKGNLKGEVESSASRDKNNGKLGGLKSNRKVKSVNGLKKVLKETGGKVVRVSPDGKGGFVAFVKTPTGKVVTVAVVGVSLLAIITFLVFNRRKSNFVSENEIPDSSSIGNTNVINDNNIQPNDNTNVINDNNIQPNDNTNVINDNEITPNDNTNVINDNEITPNLETPISFWGGFTPKDINDSKKKVILISNNSIPLNLEHSKLKSNKNPERVVNIMMTPEDVNINLNDNTQLRVNDASGRLLLNLFDQREYDLFVNRFFDIFINDRSAKERFIRGFDGSFDEFLRAVLINSDFNLEGGRCKIRVDGIDDSNVEFELNRCIQLGIDSKLVALNNGAAQMFFADVFEYLCRMKLVKIPADGGEADWKDKIISLLFGFWCSVRFNFDFEGNVDIAKELKSSGFDTLAEIFGIFSKYVKEDLALC